MPVASPFPIIGIGASAGGLDAIEQFLKNVPSHTKMAFVIVQHLDPNHKGMLAELLQRITHLPVLQITDRMRVESAHVYVIPPNADLSIIKGALHLLPPAAPRGSRLPIDFFFRSLAAEQRERSIGVILSGMGSDGTLGLRAIRAHAGAVFVQDPKSAKFDSMPRSAIEADLADVVASAEELPLKIAELLEHTQLRRTMAAPTSQRDGDREKIIGLLRSITGHDFSLYKSSTVQRRIERRMGIHQIAEMAGYVRYLRDNPQEGELLFKELLIGVTSFFRDPAEWERLKTEALPALLASCPKNAVLRAWVPACSTGEEAYSLAIVFREAVEQLSPPKNVSLQIFATDLDSTTIEKARQGVYPSNIATDVSPSRLRRFFVEEDRGYRVRREIRDLVIFAKQNSLQDPPFTKLDLLTCRNLFIYLAPELQEKLLPLFHYSLRPGGVLFLGSAETVGGFTDLFAAFDPKSRLYRRIEPALGVRPSFDFPSGFARWPSSIADDEPTPRPTHAAESRGLQAEVERLILRDHAPNAVLASHSGDVLYVSGRTGKYLELPSGKANWNVFAMTRDGLNHSLPGAFAKALAARSATLKNVKVGSNGSAGLVDVRLDRIDEPAILRNTVMIVFTESAEAQPEPAITKKPMKGSKVDPFAHLEIELRRSRDELRTTREDMQSSDEELKSANEELQSTNEELQSMNEELTTSKEEMQSMNEELQTLNQELQEKVDELSRASNDMKNLLDSTEIAILFLDDALNIRRFTPQARTLFKLIPGDVGRPLADLASELSYPALYDDAHEVLRTLVFAEKTVDSLDERRLRVRIMPYRTSDNRIDGVVITFTNIQQTQAATTSSTRGS